MDLSLEDTVKAVAKEPLLFQPGERWSYSNPGIATLGRIIEVVSGRTYEDFMKERLLDPLGMKDTFFFPPADKTPRIALVYERKDGRLSRAPASILGGDPTKYRAGAKFPAPDFALFSTAGDLVRLYQMIEGRGAFEGRRYLSPASVEMMATVHTGALRAGWKPGSGFGLTFEVVRDPMGSLCVLLGRHVRARRGLWHRGLDRPCPTPDHDPPPAALVGRRRRRTQRIAGPRRLGRAGLIGPASRPSRRPPARISGKGMADTPSLPDGPALIVVGGPTDGEVFPLEKDRLPHRGLGPPRQPSPGPLRHQLRPPQGHLGRRRPLRQRQHELHRHLPERRGDRAGAAPGRRPHRLRRPQGQARLAEAAGPRARGFDHHHRPAPGAGAPAGGAAQGGTRARAGRAASAPRPRPGPRPPTGRAPARGRAGPQGIAIPGLGEVEPKMAAAIGGGAVGLVLLVGLLVHFFFGPKPTIDAVQPAVGEPGSTITLRGDRFAEDAAQNVVRFGEAVAKVSAASETGLTVVVPDAAVPGELEVTVQVGRRRSKGMAFRVLKVLQISALEPDVALPGEEVTASGSGLDGARLVLTVEGQARPGPGGDGQPPAVQGARPGAGARPRGAGAAQDGAAGREAGRSHDRPAAPGAHRQAHEAWRPGTRSR